MIQLAAGEEAALQQWLERRLVSISDAEAPILAEYCLALLKHDQDAPQVRLLCIEQLRDFLKDSTEQFVDEIFAALESRSYMAGVSQRLVAPQAEELEEGEYDEEDDVAMFPLQERENYLGNEQMMPAIDPQMMAAFFAAMMAAPMPLPRQTCHAFARNQTCPRGQTCPYAHIEEPANSESNLKQSTLPPAVLNELRCSLTVQRIPKNCMSKAKIQDYFSTFGHVKRVRMQKASNSADVVFSTRDEAKEAYLSSAPIFGNRFVRTFWKVPPTTEEVAVQQVDSAQIAARQEQHQARQARKQEMARKLQDLEEQKRQLLQRQAAQREAIAKLERSSGEPDTRSALQVQLDELKQKALTLGIDTSQPTTPVKRKPHQYQTQPFLTRTPHARTMKLDNRPKSVLIKGLQSAEEGTLLTSHLANVPGVQFVSPSDEGMVATFQTRSAAEHFMRSPLARLGHVKRSWHTTMQPADIMETG